MGKKLNFGYGATFGAYWMVYAAISSFASVFLLAKGYNNSQIGLTLAVANLLAIVLQPLIADFADRSRKLSLIGTSEILTVGIMIVTVGMFTFKGGTISLCVVFVLLIAFHTTLQPLLNSMTFYLEKSGYAINFGIDRSVGSLAYSIFVAILGTLVEDYGINTIPVSAEITSFLIIISLIFTAKTFNKAISENKTKAYDTNNKLTETESETEEITLSMFLKRNKIFCLMNIGVLGLFFSNAALNNYMAQIVDSVGGTTEDMGRILAIMAFMEIPTMVFFKQLRNRFSCRLLLKIASIGLTVKVAMCLVGNSVGILYLAQLFQLAGFALFLPGMVYFTDEMMSRGEAVKGQAFFTTMITITTIFSSLIGGRILDFAGARTLLLISTIATAAGAAIVILVVDRVKNTKEAE